MKYSFSEESGYMTDGELVGGFSNAFAEVEIVGAGGVNIFARGKRYGRYWMLKGLREELRSCTAHVQQLLKEFEIHSALHHPHIVLAVGMEDVPGMGPAIVMEWIEGVTLAHSLRSGIPDLSSRRKIMREIAEAVEYMHSAGIVHRDLKPENVMIRRAGGDAIIIDLGLADNDSYAVLKQPAGTPGYISPEQIERGGADTTDDIYSLGVIMADMDLGYGSLAEKCRGKLNRRPTTVRQLLAAMDRYERRPKRIAIVLCGLAVTAMAVTGLIEIKSTINQRDREVSQLTDSLVIMKSDLHDLLQKSEVIDSVTVRGRQLALEILNRYDREVFAGMDENNNDGYSDAQQKLIAELSMVVDEYCDSLSNPILTDADKARISGELRAFYPMALNDYIQKWLKKIYPSYDPGV